MSRSGSRFAYVPALDGLRGFGLLFVLAFHGGFATARGSFLWVSMFFTLSGYLVTALALVEHRTTGRIDVLAFWGRRARRLMPGALLTLAGIALFGALVADPTQLVRLRPDALAALFYVVNWRFIATSTSYAALFARPAPVQHFWSLSIEEQLYVVHPLLVAGTLALGRDRRVFTGVVGGITLAAVGWTALLAAGGADADRLYFGTDTRLVELTAGMLLALVLERPSATRLARLGPLAFAAMMVATFTVDRTARWLYPGGMLACSLASCALIAMAREGRGPVRALFEQRILVWLGQLSYTIYLFHWPLFLVVTAGHTGLHGVPLFVARVAVTIAMSALSHYAFELPIRTRRRLASPHAWLAMPAGFVVVAAAIVVVTLHPPPVPVELDAPLSMDPPAAARPDTVRVLVAGDSQAYVLGRALERWAETTHGDVAVWSVARRGCGVVRGGQVDRFDVPIPSPCDSWDLVWQTAIERFDPRVAVVLSGGWDWVDRKLPTWDRWHRYGEPVFDDFLVSEYGAAADLLAARGARVVWLTAPCHAFEKLQRDPKHLNVDLIPRVAATRPGRMAVYDLYTDLCPDGAFTPRVGAFENGRPDGIHLSDAAADWVASWLGPKLVRLAPP